MSDRARDNAALWRARYRRWKSPFNLDQARTWAKLAGVTFDERRPMEEDL